MQREEVLQKVRTVIIDVLKHDKFEMTDELAAADVDGWDSLTHMVILTEIEKSFQIKFKLREINKLNNMGDLIALIDTKNKEK
jgi:acyl carrier protein